MGSRSQFSVLARAVSIVPLILRGGRGLSRATGMLVRTERGRKRELSLAAANCASLFETLGWSIPTCRGADGPPKDRNAPQPRRRKPQFWPARPRDPVGGPHRAASQREPRVALNLASPAWLIWSNIGDCNHQRNHQTRNNPRVFCEVISDVIFAGVHFEAPNGWGPLHTSGVVETPTSPRVSKYDSRGWWIRGGPLLHGFRCACSAV